MTRMYASQEVSVGPTAAPSPDLDLSSHRITMNGGGDGFSPTRSDAIPTGAHTDQLDLSSVSFSFTTEDPAVLRTRMLLVSEPDEDLSQLDVFEHGKQVLKRIQQRIRQWPQASIHDAQQYLDRLKEIDFADYSADQRREVADTVKRLAKVDGLTLQCREASSKAWKKVTNVRCNVSNDRSKGTFRVSSGSDVVTTDTPRSHFPQLRCFSGRGRGNSGRQQSGNLKKLLHRALVVLAGLLQYICSPVRTTAVLALSIPWLLGHPG